MASDGHEEVPAEEEDLMAVFEGEAAVAEALAAHVGAGGAGGAGVLPADGDEDAAGGAAAAVVDAVVGGAGGAAGIYAAAAALGGGARQAAADLAGRRRQLQIERRQVALQMRQNDRKRQRIMLRAQGLSDDDLLEILAMRAHAKGLCFSCSLCLTLWRPGKPSGDDLHGL
jgi:hypothetical protein